MSDRGVSEVVGFVLVFSLVVGTIGVVYATSITGLHDAREAERVNNVERAFDVLADNLEDLHRTGVSSRATEIKLAGGSLGTGDPIEIQVSAEQKSDPDNNQTYAINLDPIVYRDDGGTALIYAGGSVIRSEPGGAVMLSEPGWVNGSDRSVIPLVDTKDEGGGVAGDGTVLVVARMSGSRSTQVQMDPGDVVRVNVTVTSPRAEVWGRFFRDRGWEVVDETDDSVTGSFDTDSIYVVRTSLRVSFSQ